MARTWGYVIANGEDFSSSTELYEFYEAHGIEALVEAGAGYYQYDGRFDFDSGEARLVLMGCAFEDGWQQDGTVSRFFLKEGER